MPANLPAVRFSGTRVFFLHGPADRLRARVATIGMALLALATWLVMRPYGGLIHDSVIYALLALARLHPESLAGDVFLRFGSQDQYTIFSPLLANVIALLGLEPAAATLTLAAHVAFFACAWLVARRFMSALKATLGVALLIALPGEYGSGAHFHYAEPFLTPRMPAEALVLAALAATVARRYGIAVLCLLAALFMHPIMAAAGVAMLVLTFVADSRPKLTLALGAALIASSLIIIVAVAPSGRFDATWLAAVRETSTFLFLSLWSVSDWRQIALPLAGLALGVLTATTPLLRRVCAGALLTAACGLAITFVYCDWLHMILFTDLQAWRWLWLADVLVIVLSPVIVRDCWRTGVAGQTAIVLLMSAWILGSGNISSAVAAGAAVACAATPAAWREHRFMRLLLWGSCALMALAAVNDLAYRMALPDGVEDPSASIVLQKVRIWCGDGILSAAVLVTLWLAADHVKSLWLDTAITGAAALACGALLWLAGPSWTTVHYSRALYGKFAAWRAEIPPHAEVLWPDTPVGAWYLLERASYWSIFQTPGAIFSKQKALLIGRRAALLEDAIADPDRVRRGDANTGAHGLGPTNYNTLTRHGLEAMCQDPDLRYVASWLQLGPTPVAPVTPNPSKPLSRLYLYRCADFQR